MAAAGFIKHSVAFALGPAVLVREYGSGLGNDNKRSEPCCMRKTESFWNVGSTVDLCGGRKLWPDRIVDLVFHSRLWKDLREFADPNYLCGVVRIEEPIQNYRIADL